MKESSRIIINPPKPKITKKKSKKKAKK